MTATTEPKLKNLCQRILAVMAEVGYVKKDATVSAGGGSYKAVTHDAVARLLRGPMQTHGISMHATQSDSTTTEGQTRSGSPKLRYTSWYDVSLINADDPADRQTWRVEAHAEDSGDKAPGKSFSYAVKMVLLKAFMLETGDNDESRYQPEEAMFITQDQAVEIRDLIDETGSDAAKFLRWCGAASVEEIPAATYPKAIKALRIKQTKPAETGATALRAALNME